MKIIQLFIAAFLVSFLVACDRSSENLLAPVGPTSDISPSFEQTKAPLERTATATRRPSNTPPILIDKTKDVPATPAQTPVQDFMEITPIPEPINQTGPWIMLSPDIFYTGAARIVGPIFANADGSGWEPANLPHDPYSPPDVLDWWFGSISPQRPFAAFQDYLSEYQPTCQKNSTTIFPGYVDTLYILKLPENKVVRQISLFGPKALEQISKEECEFVAQGRFDTPPVLGVVQNSSSISWSPDGRYLAFPAAFESKAADLYLYDTQTDTLRRLTTRQNNPDILGWSRDGQTIIYRSITKMELFKLQFLESSGLFAVSLSGSDRLLLKPDVIPLGLQWLSKSQFLITDGPCDPWGSGLCTTHLRLVDLSTGTNEVIYSNPKVLINYVVDPIHHLLLISNPPSDMPGLSGIQATPDEYRPDLSFVPGVYHFDFSTHLLQPVLSENLHRLEWDKKLEAFRSDNVDQEPPYTKHTTLIRYISGNGFTFKKLDNLPDPSPDGKWSVGKIGEDWFILDDQNQPVQKLLSKSYCHWASNCWSPDSSTYVELVPNERATMPQLIVYQKKNNWQPTVVRQILYGQLWSYEWITP